VTEFDRVDPRVSAGDPIACAPADRHVEVWAFSLECRAGDIDRWEAQLSDDERARSAKFKRAADRNAYVCAHGVTRLVLSRYCDASPQRLRFARAAGGKPMLASNPGESPVHFNLTHSGGRALLAVSRAGEVGVDLEAAREDVDTVSLADRFFCDAERVAIAAAPLRAEAFFRHWVAKEAVLKACGTGLAFPLDAFAVQFSTDGDTATVASTHPRIASGDWLVRLLPLPPGWYGALCAPPDCGVRIRMPGGPDDG
jgi:4'-phosphopantetheinyl transferase